MLRSFPSDASGLKHSKALAILQAASTGGNQKALFEFSEYVVRSQIPFPAGDPLHYLTVCAERSLAKIHISAHAFYESGRTSMAIVSYMLASMMGYEVGHMNAAFLLKNSPERSLNYLMRAFEYSKSIDSMVSLGDHYYFAGKEAKNARDQSSLFELAVDFYAKGEKSANAQAAYNLGYCYEHGLGVPTVSFSH